MRGPSRYSLAERRVVGRDAPDYEVAVAVAADTVVAAIEAVPEFAVAPTIIPFWRFLI